MYHYYYYYYFNLKETNNNHAILFRKVNYIFTLQKNERK